MKLWPGVRLVARRRPALAVAAVVAVLSGLGLTLAHPTARLALPRGAALQAVRADGDSRAILSRVHWTSVTVSPVDGQLERVSFFDHHQIVAQMGVRRDGRVALAEDFEHRRVPYGDWIAYQPALLAGLSALFVLLTGVSPWRRMRNADLAAALSLLAPVLLLEHRYVDASVLTGLPGMVYLTIRCAWLGLGRARAPAPSRPLLLALLPGVAIAQRVRLLRTLLVVLALIYAMVGISSPVPVDVIYGVMEGATKLIHGLLPYGHMPGDVIHGDTYPLFSYALYVPLAWVAPVRSVWDSVDGALAVTVGAALVTAAALFRAIAGPARSRRSAIARGAGEPRRRARSREAEEAGLRAAIAWLAFPPLLIAVSTGTTDVVLAAMLTIALLLWRRTALCTGILAAAAWFKLAPAALLPIWLAPLRGRRLAVALGSISAVSGLMLGVLLALGGLGGPGAMIHAVAFQFSRASPQSVWTVLGLERLQPFSQACVLGLVAGAVVRLRRAPALASDRVRMAALGTAILLGLQLAADYWVFLYVIWIIPLRSLSLFAEDAPVEVASSAAVAAPAAVPAPAISAHGPMPVLGPAAGLGVEA